MSGVSADDIRQKLTEKLEPTHLVSRRFNSNPSARTYRDRKKEGEEENEVQQGNILWLAISALAIAMRWLVATWPHSGQSNPPMFGDFEAQRHWMEITRHLPVTDWYINTRENDLNYWGLDYPPLTAFHSYAMGTVADAIDPEFVALGKKGVETAEVKMFMRSTALISDVLVYFPAVFGYYSTPWLALVALMFPGLILIDHGHFQYNSVSLGLTLLAISMLRTRRTFTASFFFTLALNYKQMELYHALPFFFCLLGMSWRMPCHGLVHVVVLGLTVMSVFGAIWYPWWGNSLESTQAVLQRLFPFNRGLYESKVANFWCTANIFYKVNTPEMRGIMVPLCLATTLIASLPSCLHLLARNTFIKFKLSLFNVSMAFFLFSFHVHEKSILLPALSALALLPDFPDVSFFFLLMATSSMFPLLVVDKLVAPYFGLTLMFIAVYGWYKLTSTSAFSSPVAVSFLALLFFFAQGLNVAAVFVEPPARYPDLFPVLISAFSFGVFFLIFGYFNYVQFRGGVKKKVD